MIPTPSLPHVHRVTTRVGASTCDVFVFDHHRAAFTLWALAAKAHGPLTLVTLDRHMDLERPAHLPPAAATSTLEALDEYAARALSPRNDDHIVAALEAGAIGDAVVIARSHAPSSLDSFRPFRDHAGGEHHFAIARTVDEAGADVRRVVEGSAQIALDIDLDCFATLSDGHPDEVVPWDIDQIDTFLRPPDSESLWQAILSRTRVVTLAREPYHCGGLERGARLWRGFSEVFFRRLLGVPPP
jgi:hypothetical protein